MEGLYKFGTFELDVENRKLRRDGAAVRLQPQPFKVLAVLVSNAGRLVTRSQIRNEVWSDTFVDFDQSLNYCVKQIRAVLGDDAAKPLYIETRQRLGYSFIAPVETETRAAKPEVTARLTLAVLPFQNISDEPEQDYFSDGLTEELTTQIGRLNPERLGVIARTSAMRFKETNLTVEEIGLQLRVNFVLAGSVRRSANRVRIAAQLIQVSDQTQVWAEAYERDMGDIFALQSDVAVAVASEIRVKLGSSEQGRIADARPIEPKAVDAYLKGLYFWNKSTKEALQKGAQYFENASTEYPAYAMAYAGLADCHLRLLDYNHVPPAAALVDARLAAEKALKYDASLAQTHTSLAHIALHELRWAESERSFKHALSLNPNYGTAHYYYANLQAALGRFDSAISESQRALELDPVSPSAGMNAASIYYLAGLYDRAIEQAEKVLELDPDATRVHHYLGMCYEQKGQFNRAVTEFLKTVKGPRDGRTSRPALAHASAMAGDLSLGHAFLEDLQRQSPDKYLSRYDIALVYTGLGDVEAAVDSLIQAFEQRASNIPFIKVDPRFRRLLANPRFQDLCVRMRFPD